MHTSPASGSQFCLRQNRDGTVDSFCLKCFVTVSHGKSEVVQAQLEENHACNPYDVERLHVMKTALDKSSSIVSRDPNTINGLVEQLAMQAQAHHG